MILLTILKVLKKNLFRSPKSGDFGQKKHLQRAPATLEKYVQLGGHLLHFMRDGHWKKVEVLYTV
jgi:hypothetical protein